MKTPADVVGTDPLADVTRKERRTLVAASALGIVVAKSGLIPSRISALGIEFGETDQRVLLTALGLVVLYFLFGFLIYGGSDLIAWRLAFWRAVDDTAREHKQAQEAEVRRHKVLWLRATFWMSGTRALFEFVIPVVLALYAMLVLFAASPEVREQQAAEGVALGESIVINVPGKSITLSAADWKPMESPQPFAVNVEARRQMSGEAFPQVVTVFKLAMSESDKVGLKITSTEYVEFFVVHPGKLTLQIRLDKGDYWLLSRQTLEPPQSLGSTVQQYRPFLQEVENQSALQLLDAEVKKTRYQLSGTF